MLLSAIILAVLYFGLMALLLLDSSRQLQEAQRFRARIVAAAVAENAAEVMAMGIAATGARHSIAEEDAQGTMSATFVVTNLGFVIQAVGRTKGVMPQEATVDVYGRVSRGQIAIDHTLHSQ